MYKQVQDYDKGYIQDKDEVYIQDKDEVYIQDEDEVYIQDEVDWMHRGSERGVVSLVVKCTEGNNCEASLGCM